MILSKKTIPPKIIIPLKRVDETGILCYNPPDYQSWR